MFFSVTIFISCTKDNSEEIQLTSTLTTTDKLNILFKSSEYKNTMIEMDKILTNINYKDFSLKSALNENNTFNETYIKNNLSSTNYKSLEEFKSDFNELYEKLQFLKDKHNVLNPKNLEEITLYYMKENAQSLSALSDCASDFSRCNSKATKSFMYAIASIPTCGGWAGYCFGLAVLQYNDARGDCKEEVFECLGIN